MNSKVIGGDYAQIDKREGGSVIEHSADEGGCNMIATST